MCECKTELEAKLVERFRAKNPDATGHRATLEGYGLAIVGDTMKLMPYMPIKFGAGHENKKTGLERWKNEKGTMTFRFCPFCGENLVAATDPPNLSLARR